MPRGWTVVLVRGPGSAARPLFVPRWAAIAALLATAAIVVGVAAVAFAW